MLPQRAVASLGRIARFEASFRLILAPIYVSSQRSAQAFAVSRPSSSSSKRWKARQAQDKFVKEATVQGLKSRAAFKLLQINEKHKIFDKGQTVVDLGFAPGSWSQVAVDRTRPNGRVIGIDILPAQPPKGASSIQGNFLSSSVQAEVRRFLLDPNRGRPREKTVFANEAADSLPDTALVELNRTTEERVDGSTEQHDGSVQGVDEGSDNTSPSVESPVRMVDVVLSDMSEPWPQTSIHWNKSLRDPYFRMMNTSGNKFRDHIGSMELCTAALEFCFENLRPGGHFVCKCYQGAEDRILQTRLKKLFKRVIREKPEASRTESKEFFFIALERQDNIERSEVFE